jgi:hypothetical protein
MASMVGAGRENRIVDEYNGHMRASSRRTSKPTY